MQTGLFGAASSNSQQVRGSASFKTRVSYDCPQIHFPFGVADAVVLIASKTAFLSFSGGVRESTDTGSNTVMEK